MFSYAFPRPAVTVDTVALRIETDALKVLLIRRDAPPFKRRRALPGGFVHDREPLHAAARRVLSDKARVRELYLEQLATFGAPKRDPRERTISVAYLAIASTDYVYVGDGEWRDVHTLPVLAFDHAHIVDVALERLRAKLPYTDLAFRFLPQAFTLTQVQSVHETVLRTTLDKRNFRKLLLQKGQVRETGAKSTGGAHPPAKLYSTQARDNGKAD